MTQLQSVNIPQQIEVSHRGVRPDVLAPSHVNIKTALDRLLFSAMIKCGRPLVKDPRYEPVDLQPSHGRRNSFYLMRILPGADVLGTIIHWRTIQVVHGA